VRVQTNDLSIGYCSQLNIRLRSQPGHHIAVIGFVRTRLDKKHAGLLTLFDPAAPKAEYRTL
jgi:hypothetical protein